MNDATQPDERERRRAESAREELAERIACTLPEDGTAEIHPGIFLSRASRPTELAPVLFKPAFCLIAQGSKQVILGEEVFRYDPGHYLIATVDLPTICRIIEATDERPYLGFRMDLDGSLVASVMLESGTEVRDGEQSVRAMNVSPTGADLLDAAVRLVRLLESPTKDNFLISLVTREIVWRLLMAGQGARLKYMSGGDPHRISKAIKLLRENFDRPLKIESLARSIGMSVSSFHHHFKAVTGMSPLQFLKQIRLQEARRLMLSEGLDAASAGFNVGYEDPSYFNREYKKLFGAPPQRDIARLRTELATSRA